MINTVITDYGHGGIKEEKYTTKGNKFKLKDGVTVYEGVINRLIGGHVELLLSATSGLTVISTVSYNDPTDLELRKRVRKANKYNKDNTLFVSFHSNASSTNKDAGGFLVYTYFNAEKSSILAYSITNAVEDLSKEYGFKVGTPREKNLMVLRDTKCASVLIESLFFTNEEEAKLLLDPEFQLKIAYAIYLGIMDFINRENSLYES